MENRIIPLILLAVLSLTGCRTYGGHGSEAGILEQMAELPAWAEAEQARLDGDMQAVARQPGLEDVGQRLSELSTELHTAAGRWSAVVQAMPEDASYRELNRQFGSLVAERQAWQNGYRHLVDELSATLSGVELEPRPASRYQVAPGYFERLESGLEDVRVRDLAVSLR